jgi:hypothetical protein
MQSRAEQIWRWPRSAISQDGDSKMNILRSIKLRMFVVATSIVLLPMQQLLAANPQITSSAPAASAAPAGVVRDLALQPGGEMKGKVLDAQGQPCARVAIRVVRTSDENAVATTQTDVQGQFAVNGMTGGLYRLETPAGASIYRLWAPNTAPPAAVNSALVLQGDPTVRGNLGGIGWLGWTLIGLGVAAAVAIPLALTDDNDDAS